MRNTRLDETLMWLEYHAHARTQQWAPRILQTDPPGCQCCESVTFSLCWFQELVCNLGTHKLASVVATPLADE